MVARRSSTRAPSQSPTIDRIAQGLARRIGPAAPRFFAPRLTNPTFWVGFNNSGKSTILSSLVASAELRLYPGEGNDELWFPGLFPWISSTAAVPPIWYDPDGFLQAALDQRTDGFMDARAHLAVYQLLTRQERLLVDSGMLAALAPELASAFPDALFVHVVRDGRIAAYVTARIEWARMLKAPGRYRRRGIPLDFRSVLERMAKYWLWTVGRMEQLEQMHAGRTLQLRYEAWCAEPATTHLRLSEFLSASIQSSGANRGEYFEDSTGLVRKEIRPDEWELLQRIMWDTVAAMGYPDWGTTGAD